MLWQIYSNIPISLSNSFLCIMLGKECHLTLIDSWSQWIQVSAKEQTEPLPVTQASIIKTEILVFALISIRPSSDNIFCLSCFNSIESIAKPIFQFSHITLETFLLEMCQSDSSLGFRGSETSWEWIWRIDIFFQGSYLNCVYYRYSGSLSSPSWSYQTSGRHQIGHHSDLSTQFSKSTQRSSSHVLGSTLFQSVP